MQDIKVNTTINKDRKVLPGALWQRLEKEQQ